VNGVIIESLPEGEDTMKVKSKRTYTVLAMAHKLDIVTQQRGKHSCSSSKAQVDMLKGKR